MYGCFNSKTGEFVDQQDSLVDCGPDKLKDHVFNSYGISSDDLVVVEAGDHPWLKKWLDGKVVDDLEKIAAIEVEQEAVDTEAARLAELKDKLASGSAIEKEVQEVLHALIS